MGCLGDRANIFQDHWVMRSKLKMGSWNLTQHSIPSNVGVSRGQNHITIIIIVLKIYQ